VKQIKIYINSETKNFFKFKNFLDIAFLNKKGLKLLNLYEELKEFT